MTPDQAARIESFHRQHAPLQSWVLEAMADDPELFGITAPSRGELRALPMRLILWAMPPLVCPNDSAGAVLIHEMHDWRRRMERVGPDVKARKAIAVQARRTWARLVETADAINVDVHGTLITVKLRDV
jgi:hypothetical protein